MHAIVIRTLTALSIFAALQTADAQKWPGWSVFWENDSFIPPHLTSDRSYTNGVRFTLVRDLDHSPIKWVESFKTEVIDVLGGTRPFNASFALVFGQNFFTPEVITTFDPDPLDRPFAGHLYGGVRVDVTQNAPRNLRAFHSRFQHSFEVDLGFLGPLALADQVQTGVHLLRQSRIPKGWERQLGTELALNGSYLGRVKIGWDFLDVVPHLGVALGTVQTFANAGAAVRVGVNMSGFPALAAPWTAAPTDTPPRWEVALSAGVEGRYYLRNAYVDGGLLGGDPQVNGEPGIGDYRFGAMFRRCAWSLSYMYIHRSREFDLPAGRGDGEHDFGSIIFSREPVDPCDDDENNRGWLRSGWTFDVGIGGAISRHVDTSAPERVEEGMSMRAGASKRIIGRLAVGFELAGALRQGEEIDFGGFHRDAFLVTKAFTLGWHPQFRKGTIVIRAGAGSALYKVEATRGLEHEAEREDTGMGWLAGIGYDYPLGRTISLGLDAVWSHLSVASAAGPDASFLSTTFGFKWHP